MTRPLSATSLVLLGVLLLFVACGRQEPRLSPLPKDAVVVCFGDSLTYGTGAPSNESYPAVLENLISRRVINEGVPGETTKEGLTRLPSVLEEDTPNLVILCLGGNDFLQDLGDTQAEANLRAMIDLIRASGAQILLLGVPHKGLWLSSAKFYAKVAGDYGIPYNGKILPEILSDNAFKSDLIHPNARGYRRLAAAVAQTLVRAGALEASQEKAARLANP